MPCTLSTIILSALSLLPPCTSASSSPSSFPSFLPTVPPTAATQRAANSTTGNPGRCLAGTKFFPQAIDHATFSGDYNTPNQTFLQQYEVNDTFYKPGGPIIFMQSGENAVFTCVDFSIAAEWAQELQALMVGIEHRYFGLSCPYGLKYSDFSAWDTSLLKPLTVQSALLDGLTLLNWIKNVAYPSAKDARVLALSGSYAGTLSILYKVHYPDLMFGSIATSPVTTGLISDPKNPLTFGLGDWGNMVYNDYSNDAATIIQHGMTELKNLLTAGKFAGLQEQLHLCSAPDSTNQTHDVLAAVLKAYLINAEENSWHNNYPLYATINATLAANTSLAAVGAAVSIYNAVEGQKCLNFDPGYANGGPFMWLRCTQIPYPQSWSAAGSIWGLIAPIVDPTRNQTRLLDPYCQAAFGINSTGGGDGLQRQLGLDQDTLAATQRLLVTEGLLDPTTGLGPSSWYPGTSRNHSRIIYVGESAHTEVMNPPSPKDSDALVEARIFVLNSIKQWLGL